MSPAPDRWKTIVVWALLPVIVLGIPLTVTLIRVTDARDNTDEIKAAQAEAEEATAAAKRNGAVSACQGEYATTERGWLAEVTKAFAVRDQVAAVIASANQDEMNRRALGVVDLARQNVDQPFVCPAIPERLSRDPVDPTDPAAPR